MKQISMIAALALSLVSSACGGISTPTPASNPGSSPMPVVTSDATEIVVGIPNGKIRAPSFESQNYVDEAVGFSIDYPVGWLTEESALGSRGSQVVFVSASELFEAAPTSGAGTRVFIAIYEWEPTNDLSAFVQKTKDSWTASGATVLTEEAVTLDLGLAGVRFSVQTAEGIEQHFLIAAIGDRYLVASGEGDMLLVDEILLYLRPISQ